MNLYNHVLFLVDGICFVRWNVHLELNEPFNILTRLRGRVFLNLTSIYPNIITKCK